MNKEIARILNKEQPRLSNLSSVVKRRYENCLAILGSVISEDFFNIPRLEGNKYIKKGYFYEIPYFDSNELWESGNQIVLIAVYKLKDKTSYCPLRIDIKLVDVNNFGIYVYDQSGKKTIKKTLIERVEGVYYTEIVNYNKKSLLDLLKGGVGFEGFIG